MDKVYIIKLGRITLLGRRIWTERLRSADRGVILETLRDILSIKQPIPENMFERFIHTKERPCTLIVKDRIFLRVEIDAESHPQI